MLGDVKELKQNLWLIEGQIPDNAVKSPDIANAVVYKNGDRLYVIDTGVGPVFRKSLMRVIENAYPISEFYLLNSHLHVDHICNNNIIAEVNADRKHHYVSDAGFASLSSYISDSLYTLSDYFDVFSGYRFPQNLQLKLFKLSSKFRGIRKAVSSYVSMGTKKYEPIHTSRNTMQPLELHPDYEVVIGGVPWKGWDIEDIEVLEVRGHAPDELIFYIPQHKFLYAADLVYELIPAWPTTHRDRSLQAIEHCLAMASEHEIEMLADGHHMEIDTSADQVAHRLEKLLQNHHRLIEVMKELLAEDGSLTVDDLYKRLKDRCDDEAIASHFKWDYPHAPSTVRMRSFICTLMMQLGWPSEGKIGKKRFSLPVK